MTETDQDGTFKRSLEQLFSRFRPLPEDRIAGVHSIDRAEDGESLIVMLNLEGGGTMIVQACPGEPLTVTVHES